MVRKNCFAERRLPWRRGGSARRRPRAAAIAACGSVERNFSCRARMAMRGGALRRRKGRARRCLARLEPAPVGHERATRGWRPRLASSFLCGATGAMSGPPSSSSRGVAPANRRDSTKVE